VHDRSLQDVRRKFVRLMRFDPPPVSIPGPGRADPGFDRWLAARFSPEEIQAVFRLEWEYGERALAEWLAEIELEAGMRSAATH